MNKEYSFCRYKNEYWKSNINECIEFCGDDSVSIYGAGLYGKFTKEKLQENGIKVKKFIVTSTPNNDAYIDNIPVVVATKGELVNEKIIVSIHLFKEVEKLLLKYGISNYIVLQVDYRIPILEEKDVFDENGIKAKFMDGMVRIRITNKCPGKCDFCGQLNWTKSAQQKEMNPKWYMEYLKPLYPTLKTVLITGGDAFFASSSYEYMKMLSDEYRHITIFTESNGLTFTEKFQKLACENLFSTHFSLNASNSDTYVRGCWSSMGGDRAYQKCIDNVRNYVELLKRVDRINFAPNISMVINSRNADDVVNFIKMALEMDMSYVIFFFDYQENDMNGDFFSNPEVMRPVLKKLLEIELLLKGKFYIQFRLWVPLKELDLAEEEIRNIPICKLEEKYSDIYKLAMGRSVEGEHNKRNLIRKNCGKKELTMDEDFNLTLKTACVNEKRVCAAGWNALDLYPDGRLDFCGWHIPTLYFPNFIKNNRVDWDEIINSKEFAIYRNNMLKGDYSGCMSCCPILRELDIHV